MATHPYERIMEAAKFVGDWNKEHAENCFFTMLCHPTGVVLKVTYEYKDKNFTQENITSWSAIAQSNLDPLAMAFDCLLDSVSEHKSHV